MESSEDLANKETTRITDQSLDNKETTEYTGNKRNVSRKRRRLEIDQQDEENGIITIPNYIRKDGIRYVEKYIHVFRGYTK